MKWHVLFISIEHRQLTKTQISYRYLSWKIRRWSKSNLKPFLFFFSNVKLLFCFYFFNRISSCTLKIPFLFLERIIEWNVTNLTFQFWILDFFSIQPCFCNIFLMNGWIFLLNISLCLKWHVLFISIEHRQLTKRENSKRILSYKIVRCRYSNTTPPNFSFVWALKCCFFQ